MVFGHYTDRLLWYWVIILVVNYRVRMAKSIVEIRGTCAPAVEWELNISGGTRGTRAPAV